MTEGEAARHVVVVSHEASRTGAPRVALHTIEALRQAGWRTTTVLRWGGPLETEFRAAGPTRMDPTRHIRAALQRWPATKPLAQALEQQTASLLLKRLAPDLVWCNTVLALRWAEVADRVGIPTVVHVHEQADWLSQFRQTLCQQASRGTVRFVGCTNATIDVLKPFGITVSEVLHSPVDVEELERRRPPSVDANDVVLACGTADTRKGFEIFAEAALSDQMAGSSASWQWAGRLDEMNVPPRTAITLLGELDDPVPTMAGASIFVCPSLSESFPLVVLEAMALARPIVASDLPGIREQVADAAVLVPPGDPEALLDAVRALRADPDRAAELGRAAQARCWELWDIRWFRQRVADIADEAARS